MKKEKKKKEEERKIKVRGQMSHQNKERFSSPSFFSKFSSF
jgi:hypothetical protein